MNEVQISGRFTKEPKLEKGNEYVRVKFTIANNDIKDKPCFFDCAAYNAVAELIVKNYSQGDLLVFTGRLSSYSFRTEENKFVKGVELVVKAITFTKFQKSGTKDEDIKEA